MPSERLLLLERLRALDQDHAPNLPRHVSLDDITLEELRALVECAQRRHRNSIGPALLQPTRKTTIRLESKTPDNRLFSLGGVGDVELLPGGELLLLLGEGDLQCWTVPGGECVWRYSWDPPYDRYGLVCSFAYDMQTNGDVHILAVTEFSRYGDPKRTLAVFKYSPQEKTIVLLHKCAPKELEIRSELSPSIEFAKLSGDVSAVSVEEDLLVTFWNESRSVLVRDCFCKDLHFVDGHLIGVFGDLKNSSIIAFPLSSIRNFRPGAFVPGATQIPRLENDIPYVSCLIPRCHFYNAIIASLPSPIRNICSSATQQATQILTLGSDIPYSIYRIPPILKTTCYFCPPKLSICTFRKSEAEKKRKWISITMSADICDENANRIFPMLDSFLLETTADTAGPNASASFTSITHLENPGTIILNPQNRRFSSVSRPSQAGSVVIKFHDPDNAQDPQEDMWMLATVSCKGKVEYRTLDMPHAGYAKMEYYSGALYFATAVTDFVTDKSDFETVNSNFVAEIVIQHYD